MFAGDLPDPYTADSDRENMHALMVNACRTTSSPTSARPPSAALSDNAADSLDSTGDHSPAYQGARLPAKCRPGLPRFTLRGSGHPRRQGTGSPTCGAERHRWQLRARHWSTTQRRTGRCSCVFGSYADVSDADWPPHSSSVRTSPALAWWCTFPGYAQVMDGKNTNAAMRGSARGRRRRSYDPDVYVVRTVCTGGPSSPSSCRSRGAYHGRLEDARDAFPADRPRLGSGRRRGRPRRREAPDRRPAGPFLVRSFEKGGSGQAGRRRAITWKVNDPAARQEGPDRPLHQRRQDRKRDLCRTTNFDGKVVRDSPQGQGQQGLDHDQAGTTTTSST